MSSARQPMTRAGLVRLKEELKRLKAVERPKIVREIAEARAHGDLSENAEYHAAKEKQSHLEGRIAQIDHWIATAEVIDVSRLSGDRVVFGATVKLSDSQSGDEVVYRIVGEIEADLKQGKISVTSPIARALIGRTEGDEVKVQAPGGARLYEIVTVEFLEEDLPVVAPVLQEVVERDGLARAEDVHGAEGVLGADLHQREHLFRERLEEVLQEERDLLEAGHRVEAVGVRRVVVALHELHRVALARRGQVHGFQSQRKLEPADPVALKVGAEGERSHGEIGSVGGRARRAKNRGGPARCACEWCKWGKSARDGVLSGPARAQWPRARSVAQSALSGPISVPSRPRARARRAAALRRYP